MEEYQGPEETVEPGATGDERFILLRWWDRVVEVARQGVSRGRELWASRPVRQRPLPPPVATEEEIASLVALLARPEDPAHARALDELVVIGRPAIPALVAALQSETWIQAFRAAEALGLIGSRRAVWPLMRLLYHTNGNVRWGAAEALGRIRSRWARGSLQRVAQTDENRTSWGETVSEAAERAIARIDETWFSRSLGVLSTFFLLALCVLVVYGAYYFVSTTLEQRVTVQPTVTPTVLTVTPTVTSTPTPTLLPPFVAISGTISGDIANVRDLPDSATGTRIGALHYGDEVLVYGGRVDDAGGWWYLVRLAKINNPATQSEILEGGAYGWIHASLVAGVTAPSLIPTVSALETMRAAESTPTPVSSSLDLETPTPMITVTPTPTATLSP